MTVLTAFHLVDSDYVSFNNSFFSLDLCFFLIRVNQRIKNQKERQKETHNRLFCQNIGFVSVCFFVVVIVLFSNFNRSTNYDKTNLMLRHCVRIRCGQAQCDG